MNESLLKEIPHFESFLNNIGFKRIDGAIYGLLVLSEDPLTSEEIENHLSLSQSAISLSLKTLAHFGAVSTTYNRERRANTHSAKPDSLEIVSTVFKKREQEKIQEFRQMAHRALKKTNSSSIEGDKSRVHLRLESIISTCEIAESVINFIMALSNLNMPHKVHMVTKRLPKVLDLLTNSVEPVESITQTIKSFLPSSFKQHNSKTRGEVHE
jgi:DNA-binding transcriptional regulator GbsR (MarR family)